MKCILNILQIDIMKIKVFYVENIYGETEICFHKLETAISEVRRLLIDTIETSQIEYLVEQYLAS